MSKLTDVIKDINKKYKFNIVGKADIKKRDYATIPFVTPTLTYLFHGGLPRTILELLGLPSSGKSTVCCSICGEAQKLFRQEYQDEVAKLQAIDKPKASEKERLDYLLDRGEQKVVYLDSEFSSDEDWMRLNGVDMDSLLFIAPENQTAEQLFQIILDLIDTDSVGLVVLDSIPALVSQQAMDKTMEEKTMAGISAPLSVFCSKLLPQCNKHNCGFIGVNQIRDDMAGYHQIVSPGGKMWKHTTSVRMVIRKGRFYDSSYKELLAHPEEAYGNYGEIEVIKNKATKPDRRMSKFSITYTKGIDACNDAFDLGVALHVIEKAGAWYSILDKETGEPKIDDEGNNLKFQGKQNFIEYMRNHEQFTKDLIAEIEEACK